MFQHHTNHPCCRVQQKRLTQCRCTDENAVSDYEKTRNHQIIKQKLDYSGILCNLRRDRMAPMRPVFSNGLPVYQSPYQIRMFQSVIGFSSKFQFDKKRNIGKCLAPLEGNLKDRSAAVHQARRRLVLLSTLTVRSADRELLFVAKTVRIGGVSY